MQQLIRSLILALTGLATTALAATDRPVVGPVPDWVQPSATEIPAGPGTDAALQVLLDDEQVRFSSTATETYSDSRVRIQKPQGLQAIGTIALAWQPDADVITVHRLIVRRGSQVRDLLGNGDGFTVLRREDMLEQATLTGTLTAILQPSDLQVGDVVEFAYTRRHVDPVVPDKPDLQFAWPNTPIHAVHFRATWPKQMAVHWQLRDFKPALQDSSAGGDQSITFTLENPPPLLQPTGAPARYAAVRRLELTAFQSWPEVSRRLAPLYVEASKLTANSPLRAEIERIRKASIDPKERAAAALRLAQEQVRYVLLAMNEGALVPANADQTWQRRYGDCKAKTALLLALLRELGIEAEPVAVNSTAGDGIERLLPAIRAFDHVLVRAQIAGKTYWLDGTRPSDRRLDLLQTPFFGWGLPLSTRGSELVRIQPAPRTEPDVLREVNLDASQGADEPAQFRARAVFRGDTAFAIKLSLDNADASQRDQGMRNYWRGEFDRLQVDKVGSSFDDSGGTLTWTVEGSLRLDWSDDGFYEPGDMNPGYKPDFSRPAGTDTEAPYAVSFPEYEVNRVSVKLPAGTSKFTVSGKDIDQTLAGKEYKRTARIMNSVFTAESSRRSLVPEITAQEAHTSEAGLREMYKNRLFVVKPRALPSAAELQSQAGKPLGTAGEYIDRAYDMMRRSMYEQAIAELGSAIKLDPSNAIAWGDRGISYFSLKRFDEARVDLRKASALDPKSALALRGLGALAQEDGRTAEAIDLLSRSLQLDDDDWTRGRRADTYLQSGDAERAAQDLIVLSRSGTDPSPFERRIADLMRQNRPGDVKVMAKAVLDARVGPLDGVALATSLYATAGDIPKARGLLNEAIAKAPSAPLYTMRASIAGPSDLEATRADVEQALKLDPKFLPALNVLSSLQMMDKKYPELLQTLDRIEAASPANFGIRLTRGRTLALAGQTAAAKDAFVSARTVAKQGVEFNDLCWQETTYEVALEDALHDCDAALAEAPDSAAFLDSRGFVLLKLKRYGDAVASYDAAIARRPQQAISLYFRGIAKLRLDRKKEGEEDIAAAVALDPAIEQRVSSLGVKR